jgi:hypothetical protein
MSSGGTRVSTFLLRFQASCAEGSGLQGNTDLGMQPNAGLGMQVNVLWCGRPHASSFPTPLVRSACRSVVPVTFSSMWYDSNFRPSG